MKHPLWPLTSLAKLHLERAIGTPLPDIITNLDLDDGLYRQAEDAAETCKCSISDVFNHMLETEPLMVRAMARRERRENAGRRRRRLRGSA